MAEERRHGDRRNGKAWHKEFGLETLGLGVAEFASMAVSVGAFTFLGELAPGITNKVSKVVGKICVEPFLDTIEWGLQKTCKLKECQPDFTKSRHERAEQYANYLTLFGASVAAGVGTELFVRGRMNEWLGVKGAVNNRTGWKRWLPTKHDLTVVGIDRGTQLGAMLAVNTIGAKQTDHAIFGISSFLQKSFGWPEERAKKAAEMLVIYEGPNWVGFSAATGYLGLHHYLNRHK